jgi:hypothetical protein
MSQNFKSTTTLHWHFVLSKWTDLAPAAAGWNKAADSYCFRYTHPRAETPSTDQFLLKIVRMGPTLVAYTQQPGDEISNEFDIQCVCVSCQHVHHAPHHHDATSSHHV